MNGSTSTLTKYSRCTTSSIDLQIAVKTGTVIKHYRLDAVNIAKVNLQSPIQKELGFSRLCELSCASADYRGFKVSPSI